MTVIKAIYLKTEKKLDDKAMMNASVSDHLNSIVKLNFY